MIHVEDEWGKNKTGWAHFVKWGTADVNVVENTTLFDFEGKALPAFDAYRLNQTSHEINDTRRTETKSADRNLTILSTEGGVFIHAEEATTIGIYRLNGEGHLLRLSRGEKRYLALPSSIYMINGEKIRIK